MTPTRDTTQLPHPQWTLVNLLIRRAAGRDGWRAAAALRIAGASAEDLTALADAGMVNARHEDGREQLPRLPDGTLVPDGLYVTPARAGFRWARHNPMNRALCTLADLLESSHDALMAAVMAACGVDVFVFADLRRTGLVEVRYPVSGHLASPAEVTVSQLLDFRVKPTMDGWAVLAVPPAR